MSLFKDASAAAEVHDKILVWGPQHAGKTHFAMGFPDPVFVDREGGRALHFRDRFNFKHFAPTSLKELADAFEELRRGVPGKTVVVDSASAIYQDLVLEHTTRTERGAYVTDWVTVNRRFLACLNFAFGIANANVIFTAHQATKLVREGRDFKAVGLKFIGDERFRFAFDYIFRIEPTGDPRMNPSTFHVEKSASPNLKIGDKIRGLDYAKFVEITRSEKKPPEPIGDASADITDAQAQTIDDYASKHRISNMRVADLVKQISGGKTPLVRKLNQEQGAKLFALLQREPKAVPA